MRLYCTTQNSDEHGRKLDDRVRIFLLGGNGCYAGCSEYQNEREPSDDGETHSIASLSGVIETKV